MAAAKLFGVSPLLSSLVIVGFGTSAPELVVSIDAAINGRPDIAVGNIVGSNIFNLLGILGITALLQPLPVKRRIVLTSNRLSRPLHCPEQDFLTKRKKYL